MSHRPHHIAPTTRFLAHSADRELAWDSAFDTTSPIDSDSEAYSAPPSLAQVERETQLRLQIATQNIAAIRIQTWISALLLGQRARHQARERASRATRELDSLADDLLADVYHWQRDWPDDPFSDSDEY